MAAVTIHGDFRTQEEEIVAAFTFPPSICHDVMGPDAMILVFLILSFKLTFSLSSFTLVKRFFICFLHYSGIIHVSEMVDISPGKLDSNL